MVVIVGERRLVTQALGILDLADKQQMRANIHSVDQMAAKQAAACSGT